MVRKDESKDVTFIYFEKFGDFTFIYFEKFEELSRGGLAISLSYILFSRNYACLQKIALQCPHGYCRYIL